MIRTWMICVLLILATLAVYGRVYNYQLLNMDDDKYVARNAAVQHGLNPQTITWAFNLGYASNWHPLTWLSYMAEFDVYRLLGLPPRRMPGAMHLTNVLLHLMNTLLLFTALVWMTGCRGRSAVVAGLFALHPLHVESVAWVAERKDVLSGLFWMLTLLAYAVYAQRGGLGRYLLVVLLFALGLLAKPMLVSLPLVLLLLDFWPLQRVHGMQSSEPSPPPAARIHKRPLSWLLLEKTPLIALAALSSWLTVLAQRRGGALVSAESLPLTYRAANAVIAYVRYLGKTFWPMDLAVFYPYPIDAATGHYIMSRWHILAAAVLLAAVSARLTRDGFPDGWTKPRHRYLLVGWLWFLGTLVPVIGLVQVGPQALADRYTYLPLIGLFILLTWASADLLAHWKVTPMVQSAAAVVILLICAALSWRQVGVWRNNETLFTHAIRVTQGNYLAHTNLGNHYHQQDQPDIAQRHYETALRYKPTHPSALNNLAVILINQGRLEEAYQRMQQAVRINPSAEIHFNMANLCRLQGRLDEAAGHYRQVLALHPRQVDAHLYLAQTYQSQGRYPQAVEHLETALRQRPDDPRILRELTVLRDLTRAIPPSEQESR